MAMRMFTVTKDVTIYRSESWEVEAETFAQAIEAIDEGYGTEVDWEDYDWQTNSIDSIVCQDCMAESSEACECEAAEKESLEEFMAEIGL